MSVDAATLYKTPFSLTSRDSGAADPRTCAHGGHTAHDNQPENLVLLPPDVFPSWNAHEKAHQSFIRLFLPMDILSADLATVAQVRSHTATFLDRI